MSKFNAVKVGEVPNKATHIFRGYTDGELRYETWVQASSELMVSMEVEMLTNLGCDKVEVIRRETTFL